MISLKERNDPLEKSDLSALICVDEADVQEVVIDHFEQLSFGLHTALDFEEAATRIRSHTYNAIVISETFAGSTADANFIVREIDQIPLANRRDMFVIMIGFGMITRSDLQGFICGIDLALNTQDVFELKTLAGKGIVRQEEFYSNFKAVLNASR